MKKTAVFEKNLIRCYLLLGSASLSAIAVADESWELRASAQTVYAAYSGAQLRDDLFGAGVYIGGDYLEKGGFILGYSYTEVQGKGAGVGTFDSFEENAAYLSGRLHSYSDSLAGKISWRLDGYLISNDASEAISEIQGGAADSGAGPYVVGEADIGVVNPIVSYMNHDKDLSVELGYSHSNYDYDGRDEYQVHQLTPALGFSVAGPNNWVQLRGYFIHISDDEVNDGKNDTSAVEAKLTHWFGPSGPLGLDSLGFAGMLGERFLAVDSDAAVVYTLADEQQGVVSVNGRWKLDEQTSIMLQAGYEQFENRAINDEYDSTYIYLNLSHKW
ncbi:hypothetical protein R0135_04530 [Congregibacter variabilis]|uniref:Uncharacterized protein n=1 Tax=Congregibacter variabilis TaxID=3081200 RepID=A0ABZ0I4H8_9GAMM|nr:hypothetical protein R0135_04530 [Congregibacter sp. IMCC43200]